MKEGRSLEELARVVTENERSKRDFIADTRQITLEDPDTLNIQDIGGFSLTELAHTQIAQRVQIPQKYYDRMRTDAPELLTRNVNHWFAAAPEPRLIRTLDGRARAFLSNRYRMLDHYDLLNAILPKLNKVGCMPESMEITERKLYLKCLFPRIEREVSVGDVVQAGLVISNSEIGLGSLRIEPLLYRLRCRNGLIAPDGGLVKFHLGRALGEDEDSAFEVYREETIKATDRAFWMRISDVVDALLTPDVFDRLVNRLREAKDQRMTDIPKAIEVTQTRLQLTDDERDGVLNALVESGESSLYALVNAVTAASQQTTDYDRATELERSAWSLLELPQSAWSSLN